MERSKTITTVLITVLVIAILAAGGFALYRLGYTRGLSASVGDSFGGWFSRGFGGRSMPDLPRGGFHMFGTRQAYSAFPFIGGIFGLVLFGGIVALAIFGIVSLIRRNQPNNPQASSSSPVEMGLSEGEMEGGSKSDTSRSDDK